jgi:hypothetical protein
VTEVPAPASESLGVETDVAVFRQAERGDPAPVLVRHDVTQGTTFAACAASWSTVRDGVPVPGMKYVVEARVVLFATNVPLKPGEPWNPHAGVFRPLWSATLRQAEE